MLLCYPLQILTANRSGSTEANFPKGVVSENLVLSNISNRTKETVKGRFDGTKFSKGFPFGKLGVIEPLRCCVIHCTTDNKQVWFDSSKFAETEPFRKFRVAQSCVKCYPLQIRTTNWGGSTAANSLKVVVSENQVLRNLCVFRT